MNVQRLAELVIAMDEAATVAQAAEQAERDAWEAWQAAAERATEAGYRYRQACAHYENTRRIVS